MKIDISNSLINLILIAIFFKIKQLFPFLSQSGFLHKLTPYYGEDRKVGLGIVFTPFPQPLKGYNAIKIKIK